MSDVLGAPAQGRYSYTMAQKTLHWVIALLALVMVVLGLIIGFGDEARVNAAWGPGGMGKLYDAHKGLGPLVLILMLVRVYVRRRDGKPPYAVPLTPFEATASTFVHHALYLFLIVVPLLGWIGVSAYPAPIPFFGLFEFPHIWGDDRVLSDRVMAVHKVGALTLSGLIVVHIAAALYHAGMKGDGVIRRMLG